MIATITYSIKGTDGIFTTEKNGETLYDCCRALLDHTTKDITILTSRVKKKRKHSGGNQYNVEPSRKKKL